MKHPAKAHRRPVEASLMPTRYESPTNPCKRARRRGEAMKRQLRPPIWRRWLVRLADPFGGLDDWVIVTRALPCPETVAREEAEHRYGRGRVLSVEPVWSDSF